MRDFLKSVFSNFIANLLWAVVGFAVIVLAWLKQLPTYQLLLIALSTVALVFWCINQIDIFREKHRRGLTKYTDSEIENTVRKWIDRPEFTVQRNKANPNTLFQFTITDFQKTPVAIIRLKNAPSQLLLAVRIVQTEERKLKLAALQEPKKSDIIFSLRVEMARFGIGFSGIEWPLQQIDLTDAIPLDDSLTEFYFLQRIMFMRRARVLITELISQALKQPININESVSHKGDSQA